MGTQPDEVSHRLPGADPQVQHRAADIDQTLDALTTTVREIGDRLDPGHIARDAGDAVREATAGKVEKMTTGAQEAWEDLRTGNAGGLVDMVRENPIPAGMIGLGLAMMFLGRGSQGSQSRRTTIADGRYVRSGAWEPRDWRTSRSDWSAEDSRQTGQQLGMMTDNARNAIGDTADRLSSTASDTADRISSTASDMADRAGDMADRAGDMVSDLPRRASAAADTGSWQMRRMLNENPLGVGVMAIAAGAAIGMLLPTTQAERQVIGPTRERVMDQAASAASDAIDTAEQAANQALSSQGAKSSHSGQSSSSAGTSGSQG